jgi:hypothetical protein
MRKLPNYVALALAAFVFLSGCTLYEDYFVETLWLKRSDEVVSLRLEKRAGDLRAEPAEIELLQRAGVKGRLSPVSRICRGNPGAAKRFKLIVVLDSKIGSPLSLDLLDGRASVVAFDGKSWATWSEGDSRQKQKITISQNGSFTEYEIQVRGATLGGTAVAW